jgi:hypothetical protein
MIFCNDTVKPIVWKCENHALKILMLRFLQIRHLVFIGANIRGAGKVLRVFSQVIHNAVEGVIKFRFLVEKNPSRASF